MPAVWGGVISGVASIAGGIFGKSSADSAAKKQAKAQKKHNENVAKLTNKHNKKLDKDRRIYINGLKFLGGLNAMDIFKNADFLNDKEKINDFYILSKEEFLKSYSYLTEQEYDNTKERTET